MKKRKLLVIFAVVAAVTVVLTTTSLAVLSDWTIKRGTADTININAIYNDTNKTLDVHQTVKYKNRTKNTLQEVKFHIYANAYREGATNPPVGNEDVTKAYPTSEKSFGGIIIKNDGYAVSGTDGTLLTVPVKTLKPQESTVIKIDYIVNLANIKHRLGWTDDAINLANFYPVPVVFENGAWQVYPYHSSGDPFYNAVHNFNVKIKYPSKFVAATSGTIKKSTKRGGDTQISISAKSIRDYAIVLSQKFRVVSRHVERTSVKYFYINDDSPNQSLDVAAKAVKFFSKNFVRYPYKQLSVVQTDFLHGGMEYGELVYISCDSIAERADHHYVIVHEIAHQWWYGLVGNNQCTRAWLDEGLTEYSTAIFFDAHPAYGISKTVLMNIAMKNYSSYVKLIRVVNAKFDANMNRALGEFNSSYEYVYMTYIRGFLLFCEVEKILGYRAFIGALETYADTHKFKTATQDDFVNAVFRATGVRIGLFVETYTMGSPA